MGITHVVGIDEAGRGPLAGPVAVGIAAVPVDFDWNLIPGVGDSKKVTPKNREAIFRRARMLKQEGKLDYSVRLISAAVIDRIGITKAVALGISRCCASLALDPDTSAIKLDGLLRAPEIFLRQETIIKGDAKERVIGLASILAKVTRDRHMVRMAKQYPEYGFDIHKGYGTKMHREAIMQHSLCKIHREGYCKAFQAH